MATPTVANSTPKTSSASSNQNPSDLNESLAGALTASGLDGTKIVQAVAVLAGIALLGGAGYSGYRMMSTSKNEKAANALYQAKKAFEKDVIAQGNADPAVKTEIEKAKTDAQKFAVAMDKIGFSNVQVDTVYASSVPALKGVAKEFKGTRAGFEALVLVGNLYANHQQYPVAAQTFEEASKTAPAKLDEALALMGQASALENSGEFAKAAAVFENAAAKGGNILKGDALLGVARCYELSKDSTKAKAAYDKILTDLPNTEFAKTAELAKKQLQ